jgi:hypothetical protein
MPQNCDVGQTALLPLRRKACCGFFRLKNPTASAGFEPAMLGTRGQQFHGHGVLFYGFWLLSGFMLRAEK